MAFKVLSKFVALKNELFSGLKKQLPNDGSFKLPQWEVVARVIRSKIGLVGGKPKDGGREILSLCNAKSVADITFFPDEVIESDDRLMELFEVWMVENGKRYFTQKEKLRRFEYFRKKVFSIYTDMPLVKRHLHETADLSRIEHNKILSS